MSEQQFDVFLAHNSKDKSLIRQMYRQLKERGIKPWLDEEEIAPGTQFQDEIQQAISRIKTAAICIGPNDLGRWQALELKTFISQCVERDIPVIPVLLPEVTSIPENLLFLREFHAVRFINGIDDEYALFHLQWGITGQKPKMESQMQTALLIQNSPILSSPPEAHQDIEATQRELEPFQSQPSKETIQNLMQAAAKTAQQFSRAVLPDSANDDLASEREIDYTRLRDLLKAGEWEKADNETYEVMIRTVGKKSGGWFTSDELLNFPCADLKTIDWLWVKYSKGQFGFSVQKEIYIQCGAKLDGGYSGDKIWEEFCDHTGWRVNGSYICYSDVIFSTSAPRAHLPVLSALGVYVGWWGRLLGGGSLFSRIQTCEIG